MSRIDRIKEEIGWLKVAFGLLVAIAVSLVGWLAQNYSNPNRVLVIVAVSVTVFIADAILRISMMTYRRIKELGDL